MSITDVLTCTDWELLAQQKLALLETIGLAHDVERREELTGLLSWIDAVQDAAEAAGFPVIFLTEDKE